MSSALPTLSEPGFARRRGQGRGRRNRGFTLMELVVSTFLFLIFSTILVTVMTMCLNYWGRTKDEGFEHQNAWTAISTIASEFRQAVAPAGVSTPLISPTSGQSTTLTFYEPASTYTLASPTYQIVSYTVETPVGGVPSLTRWVTANGVAGTHVPVMATATVPSSSNPTPLAVSFTYRGPNSVDITITSQEGSQPAYALTVTATTVVSQ